MMRMHGSMVSVLGLVAVCGCATESLSETSQEIIDYGKVPLNLTWSNASHNTYLDANTRGAMITSHFGDKDGDGSGEGEYADTNHIEIDLRDNHYFSSPLGTVLAGVPGDWIVSHGAGDPFTQKCGEAYLVSDCVDRIAQYHSTHPGHPLITVWFDKKQDWQSLSNPSARSPQRLNDLILARFPSSELFKPSDLRVHDADTLRDGLGNLGWPDHAAVAGKVAFFMTAEKGKDGNSLLSEMITTLGWDSVIFPAPSASAAEEIEAPNGFGDAKDWAVVFNFEWVDENDDSECDSPECYFLRDAHDRKFLTRAYDIDDAGEADMASAGFVSGGYGYANFIPVDYPWLRNQDGGHGNFPDGIYPH